jgi:hypothetical protein
MVIGRQRSRLKAKRRELVAQLKAAQKKIYPQGLHKRVREHLRFSKKSVRPA